MKDNIILLVDADGDCEELVVLAAAQTDHDVRWVKSSREAFAVLDGQISQLAAVIVDVDPGTHGLALLEAVSSCAERPPMLVLTALEETYMEPIAKRHGAVACLGKPIGLPQLRATLRDVYAQCSPSSDCWGHLTAPPVDKGLKIKAAVRGISKKMSISTTKSRRLPPPRKDPRAAHGPGEKVEGSEIRNILVPIDFFPLSIEAVKTAKVIARYFNAQLHLAHVHHPQYPVTFVGPVFSSSRRVTSFQEHQKETLHGMLKELAHRCELPAAGAVHLCEGAAVFDEVCRLAEKLAADLIVMPTHGRSGLKHFFLGSTAERIVQHAPCPVLVMRPRRAGSKRKKSAEEAAGKMKTILVPVDFSVASLRALQYAIDFASRVSAKLLVFHATYLGDMSSVDGFGESAADLTKIAREDAARQMQEFVGMVEFGEVHHETVVQLGRPVFEICRYSNEREVDLIITATHGRTGFEHLLIGSVAEQVVRRSGRSVLVVPSHPQARIAGLTRRAARRAQQKKEASFAA